VLVVCGGPKDADTLKKLEFEQVTISNLDTRIDADGEDQFAPYDWSFQDAESLSFPDNAFDLVIVYAGLHHLHSPHRGILEMYRVASTAVLGIEPHDNFFTKLGVKWGFGQSYETAAVFYNGCKFGGVANTRVPNFVYRFTRSEIRSTIQCNNPIAQHTIRFYFNTAIPGRLFNLKNKLLGALIRLTQSLLVFVGRRIPSLSNNIAFLVLKPKIPDDLFPWLELENEAIEPNQSYLEKIYTKPASAPEKEIAPAKNEA
jgi:SAM-dependent methyltransferase